MPFAALVIVVAGGLVAFGPLGVGHARAAISTKRPAVGSPIASEGSAGPPPTTPGLVVPVRAPAPAPMGAGWVKAENAKAGTTSWHLVRASRDGAIEGYANVVSAQRGDTVSLYVSTKATTYTVHLFRMGYYGGSGAREVWASPTEAGVVQAAPTVTSRTQMVEARWHKSLEVNVDPTWPPGDYLFRLIGDNGYDSYIPLTVRDDTSTSALLINNSVTTWQAYNLWGGASLYSGRRGRADVVSFDRPYLIGDGSGDFLGNEFPIVSLIESLGLDISYTTDVDLHEHPELLLQHRAFVSLGHDEYWSTAMRDGVEAARDQGVNLAFFGANAVYRHIRLEPSPLGLDRHEINYRSRADPIARTDKAEVTVSWREYPVNRPESSLLGELYQCNPVRADFIVAKPDAWVFAGTDVHEGTKIIGLIGSEYDGYEPGMPSPPNVEIVAHSPLRCRGSAGYSDFTYYAAPSGSGVIDVGTNNWVPLLTNPWSQPILVQITANILTVFGAGPAGPLHPSVANYKSLPKVAFPPPLPSEDGPVTTRPRVRPGTTSTTRRTTSTSTSTPSDTGTSSESTIPSDSSTTVGTTTTSHPVAAVAPTGSL